MLKNDLFMTPHKYNGCCRFLFRIVLFNKYEHFYFTNMILFINMMFLFHYF